MKAGEAKFKLTAVFEPGSATVSVAPVGVPPTDSKVLAVNRMVRSSRWKVFGGTPKRAGETPRAPIECFSEGETVDEARSNLWDGFEQVMAYHREEARKHVVPGAVREELQLAAS